MDAAEQVRTIIETLNMVRATPEREAVEDRLLERMLQAAYPETESQHN